MKIRKHILSFLIASFAFGLQARTPSDSISTRISTHDWLFSVGHLNVLSTYLSPLEYTGPSFGLTHRSERLARWGRGHVTVQARFSANGGYVSSPTDDNHFYDGHLSAAVAFHRNWHPSSSWRLAAGGQAELGGGITYSLNGGNNPAEGRITTQLAASALAEYTFRVHNRQWGVLSQIDVPVLGLAFTPTYGQSYYELFYLGHTDRNIRLTQPFNAPSLRWTTLCRIPLWGATLSLGYEADIRQSHLGGLKYHAWNNSFMIGYTRRIKLLR